MARRAGKRKRRHTADQGRRPAKTTRSLSLGKKLLFAAVTVVGLLGIVELALFLVGVRPARFVTDPYVGFESSFPLYVKETDEQGTRVYRTGPEKAKFFNPQSFSATKEAGTYRIFCLGGSTTQGFPYGNSTSYPGWLQALLPAADPTRRWEVINCGAKSYASYRVAKLMEELVRYEPDLFIVYSAHNEFLERRTYGNIIERPAALTWLDLQFMRLRSYSVMKYVADRWRGGGRPSGSTELPAEVETMLDNAAGLELYERDDALQARIYDHYGFNLARMVQIARSAEARILFVQPVRNVLDFLPFKSQFQADLTPAARAAWQQHFLAGIVAAAKQDHAGALAQFNAAAQLDPRYAELHYEMGRVYFDMGQFDKAREALERAIDEDVCPVRATGRICQVLSRIADEYQVDVIPFADLLEDRSDQELHHRLLGDEFFVDHVHTTIPIHQMLAQAILDYLIGQGTVVPAPDWDESKARQVAESVNAQIDETSHAEARRLLAITLAHAGNLAKADRANRHGVWLQQAGEYDLAEDRYRQSLEFFRQQLGDDSPYVTATMDNVAKVLFVKGELEEAEPIFLEVLKRQTRQFGDRHPAVQTTRKRLAALRQAMKRKQQK